MQTKCLITYNYCSQQVVKWYPLICLHAVFVDISNLPIAFFRLDNSPLYLNLRFKQYVCKLIRKLIQLTRYCQIVQMINQRIIGGIISQ